MNKNTKLFKRILLVEDDDALEPIFASIIESLDSSIILDCAHSGEEAMSLLEGAADSSREFGLPYDLVISDIFLEGADSGLDLYEHCQQEFPEMPVLVMSGVKQCKLSGMIGSSNICPPFLQKPFRVSACREALQSFGI